MTKITHPRVNPGIPNPKSDTPISPLPNKSEIAKSNPGPKSNDLPRKNDNLVARNSEAESSLHKLRLNLTRAAKVADAKKSTLKHLAFIHHPRVRAEDDPWKQVKQVGFSHQPGMDDLNQRLAWAKAMGGGKSDGTGDVITVTPSKGDSSVASGSGAETPTPDNPPKVVAANAPQVLRGHVLRDQLPPDPKLILSSYDIKRERAAETGGYDRSTLESIRRGQATVALIGRF